MRRLAAFTYVISYNAASFAIYDNNDFNAPFTSGSALYDVMLICLCSMGTMGRIANGAFSNAAQPLRRTFTAHRGVNILALHIIRV